MCAIAGVIDWNAGGGPAPEICEQMLQTMRQRGPDQTGSYRDNEALLLSARLCVTAPDSGCQPMEAWRGGEHFVLVCDGEIYNADEVRAELTGLGLAPRTRSDAEVL
ncbi:MAG: asparagine synthetase B, partial [Candidatus Limiplasma sp.]|nr:asparagine synthetase B [Candidatus Limiplasma sp.]